MTIEVPAWAASAASGLPVPLVFATVSGAHLYGFASADSDLDVRAAHILPATAVLGLHTGPETLQQGGVRDGVEHAHHYLGFATSQQRLFEKTGELKPALYLLRVLLTGIHLMRTGTLETDLAVLGQTLPYVPSLIAAKRSAEHTPFPEELLPRLRQDTTQLRLDLQSAQAASRLPSHPAASAVATLNALVIDARLRTPEPATAQALTAPTAAAQTRV
nr:nucleotidyltransferase domain-containing protein [uncultured Actinoplanes sp.]